MPPKDDQAYVLDMLEAARLIRDYMEGVERTAFNLDQMRQDAIIRRIEIIGEATKRLSEQFRDAHPEIVWKDMAGMRDFVIHQYDKVLRDRVWNTATLSIPQLIAQLEALIPPENDTDENPSE